MENLKIFGIAKTGYTAGIYWNTWEYYTCIYSYIDEYKWTKKLKLTSFTFQWQYWADERIRVEMEKKGFNYSYISANVWKLNKKDIYKNTKNETEALNFIKDNI